MQEQCDIAVTGALGYTGRYITERLVRRGHRILSLTGHPDRPNPFGENVRCIPFYFDAPEKLAENLRRAKVLFNTYWVRFSHGENTIERAVENTRALLRAAQAAGVERIVHVSIANPSEDSPLPYYSGKAALERNVRESGLTYAILRPTVIFGREDILINNIAWFLRRVPVFGIPGDGRYGIQPIFVEDMADLAVELGSHKANVVVDAVGPEKFSFEEMVRTIAGIIGSKARIIRVPPGIALLASRVVGAFVGDVVLTPEEIKGLMANLLVSKENALGKTSITDWLRQNADTVGKTYASEMARHFRK